MIDGQEILTIVKEYSNYVYSYMIRLKNDVPILIQKCNGYYLAVPPKHAGEMEKIFVKNYPEAVKKYIEVHNLKQLEK